MKFVDGNVPALPTRSHAFDAAAADCQLARPVASEVRTFPFHGDHPAILIVHHTDRLVA